MNEVYFDIARKNHITFLQYLNTIVGADTSGVEFIKFGYRTQHLFKDGNYIMTVNWNLI